MTHIDLYQQWHLDPAASSPVLSRQLGDQLATVPSGSALRHDLDLAHRILSDPAARASYDAQLADPAAPPIDHARLIELAAGDVGAAPTTIPPGQMFVPAAATSAGKSPLIAVLSLIAAVLVALVTIGLVFIARDSSPSQNAATSVETVAGTDAPRQSTDESSEPAAPPVEGAYPGAGGPRPADAIALPTYVSKYTKQTSAHLLTPTGGIGCDFYDGGADGNQGQCGVRSMNTSSSPLGTDRIGGSTKGKWLFQFADDRVGAPIGSTGTTGWMNQPLSDGYQVPRVEYGKQYYFRDWVCASETNGLTCWNTTTGSGVFLSNERAETFDGPGSTASPNNGTETENTVLGSLPSNGKGYGSAKPTEIYAGGSPTSRIYDITWSTWGGERAEGTGTGTYRVDGRVGREEYIPATIVASGLGTCDGKRAYTKITWHFPSKGEEPGSRNSMDICWSER